MSEFSQAQRPRQEGVGTERPPASEQEEVARPRHRRAQAETSVTDVSREAARSGEQPYTVWSSERAFILSTAAAGVGLGNLWRFPTIAGENGGAAFLFCYLIAVLFFSVPFAALEIAAGRRAHGSTLASFSSLSSRLVVLGIVVVLLTLMIDSYYFVVTGWTLGYAVEATLGALPSFEAFTSGYASVVFFLITCALVTAVLFFGISGIERFARVMMPALILAIIGLCIFSLAVGDSARALSFLFKPDLSQLSNDEVWRAAFGQAFYSLTIGQGYLITYGSYLPKRVNVLRSVLSIASVNSIVAILAGLAIFPLLFSAGLNAAGGSALAFNALPKAFAEHSWGAFVAPIFFWLFFLAAFSSCIGGAKVVTAAIREQLSVFSSKLSVLVGLAAIIALGLPSAFSYSPLNLQVNGIPVLDFIDRTLGTNAVLIVALISICALAWSIPCAQWQRQLGLRTPWLADSVVWLSRACPLLLLGAATLRLL